MDGFSHVLGHQILELKNNIRRVFSQNCPNKPSYFLFGQNMLLHTYFIHSNVKFLFKYTPNEQKEHQILVLILLRKEEMEHR